MNCDNNDAIIIHFPSNEAKGLFLAGIMDGWGENFVQLEWDYKKYKCHEARDFRLIYVDGMEPEKA